MVTSLHSNPQCLQLSPALDPNAYTSTLGSPRSHPCPISFSTDTWPPRAPWPSDTFAVTLPSHPLVVRQALLREPVTDTNQRPSSSLSPQGLPQGYESFLKHSN